MLNLNLILVPVIALACLALGLTLENELVLGASVLIALIGYLIDRHLRFR